MPANRLARTRPAAPPRCPTCRDPLGTYADAGGTRRPVCLACVRYHARPPALMTAGDDPADRPTRLAARLAEAVQAALNAADDALAECGDGPHGDLAGCRYMLELILGHESLFWLDGRTTTGTGVGR